MDRIFSYRASRANKGYAEFRAVAGPFDELSDALPKAYPGTIVMRKIILVPASFMDDGSRFLIRSGWSLGA